MLSLSVKDRILVARVAGELDLRVAEDFRKGVDEAIEKKEAQGLMLNLAQVSFIDSSGLGAILGRYKRLSQKGGKVAIYGAKPAVKRILEFSGIPRIIGVFDQEPEALAYLKEGR